MAAAAGAAAAAMGGEEGHRPRAEMISLRAYLRDFEISPGICPRGTAAGGRHPRGRLGSPIRVANLCLQSESPICVSNPSRMSESLIRVAHPSHLSEILIRVARPSHLYESLIRVPHVRVGGGRETGRAARLEAEAAELAREVQRR